MKKLTIVLWCIGLWHISSNAQWTQVHKKLFSSSDYNGKQLLFKQFLQPSTQLIFSWNAQRPTDDGFFTFYMRVRDAKTKKWQPWHLLAKWGAHIQESFFNRVPGSVFNYARLEMDPGHEADACEVKVEAYKAPLELVQGVFVAASHFGKFASESYAKRGKDLPSYYIKNVSKKSQQVIDHPRANALCSPTSLCMVVESLLQEPLDSLTFAQHVYDAGLNVFGNWAFNTAHAFEYCAGQVLFYPARLNSFTELYDLLHQNIPIAVSVRGWMEGAKKPYDNGHLLVVVGWDAKKKKVICYDPAFEDLEKVEVGYDIHDFVTAWERSRRLIYRPEVRA